MAALVVLRAVPSHAHAVGISRGEYRAESSRVHAELVFARKELLAAFPDLDADRDGNLAAAEISRARIELFDWIGRSVEVRVSENGCRAAVGDVRLADQDGLAFDVSYECVQPATSFSVTLARFEDLSLGHRHLVTATIAPGTIHAALYEARPEAIIQVNGASASSARAGRVVPSLFRLGIEHILTGYDHLLFLFALILVGGSLRALLAAITAFTLAHSLTLAVAALGIWIPRPALVEPAIALSIVCVGVENCFVSDMSGRWRLTFAFGLIHGFGFAGALREIALPAAELPLALVSFNMGVELGQLAVLALVLPLVRSFAERAWFTAGGLQTCSIAISAMGLWWFVERVAG